MAYVNLLNQSCADSAELFCRMRDFLCKRNGTYDYSGTGIGWTLHDSSYAADEDNPAIADWFVIYSPGENGKEDLYFKVYWFNAANMRIEGHQSWNATTHAGANSFFYTSNFNFWRTGTDVTLYVYGDLTSVVCIAKDTSTAYYATTFGKLNKSWNILSTTTATCSSALTAGSDVSITVDAAPSNWKVGREIFIRTTHDNATSTVKIEKTTIKTITGNVITADLANNYTANSKLSDFVGYYASRDSGFTTLMALISEKSVKNVSALGPYILNLLTNYLNPAEYEDSYPLLDVFFQDYDGMLGCYRNIKKIPSFVTGFTYLDVLVEDDGTEWRCFGLPATSSAWCFKEV